MSLLAEIAVRGFHDANLTDRSRFDDLGVEPVAIDCTEISHGWFDLLVDRDEVKPHPLYQSLHGLPTRPPFAATWLEWSIPMDRHEFIVNRERYSHMRDGALVIADDDQSRVVLFCQGNESTKGVPVCYGMLSLPWSFTVDDERNRQFADEAVAPALTPLGVRLAHAAIGDPDRMNESDRAKWRAYLATAPASDIARDYMVGVGAWHVVVCALRMMHVKNVGLADKPTRRKAKKQRRLRPDQRIQWKTLTVTPGTGASGNGSGSQSLTAHHIVRGHFATYTAEKPLFGKYVGTYWREAHVRGSADAGEVHKDYRVAA